MVERRHSICEFVVVLEYDMTHQAHAAKMKEGFSDERQPIREMVHERLIFEGHLGRGGFYSSLWTQEEGLTVGPELGRCES